MDPVQAGANALLHYGAGRLSEARVVRSDLRGWIRRGGFRPTWPEIVQRYSYLSGEPEPDHTQFILSIRGLCADPG